MRSFVTAIPLTVSSFLTACSSETVATDTTTSAAVSSPDSFCDAYCKRVNACDSSSDVQTCTETCMDTTRTAVDKLRSDVVVEIRSCWETSDCRQVLGGSRLNECVEIAAVSAAPQASAKAFCDALGASATKCDGAVDRAECLELVKVYSDDTLEHARKCTTKACSAIVDCVDATL